VHPAEALRTLAQHAAQGCPGSDVLEVDTAERVLSAVLKELEQLRATVRGLEGENRRLRDEVGRLKTRARHARRLIQEAVLSVEEQP
jgi:cell division protein FtsB